MGRWSIDQGRHTGAKPGEVLRGAGYEAAAATSSRERGSRGNPSKSSWFQRYLLPGLAFKAVVIGGGYATGRELAEFFLPSGPRGGLWPSCWRC